MNRVVIEFYGEDAEQAATWIAHQLRDLQQDDVNSIELTKGDFRFTVNIIESSSVEG